MASVAEVWNHPASALGSVGGTATPMSGPASGTSGTSGSSAAGSDASTISANDFLTLLVTEMKNQDPTANTDPNEYINQLVNVNSLEQLISINQNLTTALGGSSNSAATSAAVAGAGEPGASRTGYAAAGGAARGLGAVVSSLPQAHAPKDELDRAKYAPGNLSIPDDKPTGHRVAQALSGQSHLR